MVCKLDNDLKVGGWVKNLDIFDHEICVWPPSGSGGDKGQAQTPGTSSDSNGITTTSTSGSSGTPPAHHNLSPVPVPSTSRGLSVPASPSRPTSTSSPRGRGRGRGAKRSSSNNSSNGGSAKTFKTDHGLAGVDDLMPLKPKRSTLLGGPIYPKHPGALVLYEAEPVSRQYEAYAKKNGIVPVVVDPKISTHLMQEQIDGLKFMFNHFRNQTGCILAHEQGTGKTFTTVALCHTLLEQKAESPGKSEPAVKKIVIVSPKHMVRNWIEEFRLWLGSNYVDQHIVFTKSKPKEDEPTVEEFIKPESQEKILIMSYENMKKYARYFSGISSSDSDSELEEDMQDNENPLFDLLICDEVHVLKNVKSKVSQVHNKLKFRVKIGLTGTPGQNSIEELINQINFVNPGLFVRETGRKDYKDFFDTYVRPLSMSNLQAKGYYTNDEENALLMDLKQIIAPVLHLRSNSVEADKHELIICTKLSQFQDELYKDVSNIIINDLYKGKHLGKKFSTVALTVLKSICHHPELIRNVVKQWSSGFSTVNDIIQKQLAQRPGGVYEKMLDSSKIQLAMLIVTSIKEKFKVDCELWKQDIERNHGQNFPFWERVVIVSQRTESLKVLEKLLDRRIPFLTYYGKTTSNDKLDRVKKFNDPKDNKVQVLLLSSKAGGTGLNLDGGNHLILLDPDWNPANDEQVMARIYRPGQKRNCYLYRLICAGTVEEIQMYRQNNKTQLKEVMINPDVNEMDALQEGQKAAYVYNSNTFSTLHDAICCTKPSCSEIKNMRRPVSLTAPAPSMATDDTNSEDDIILDMCGPMELVNGQDFSDLDLDETGSISSEESSSNIYEHCLDDIFVTERPTTNISTLSKWNHYHLPQKDAIAENPDLTIMQKIWFGADDDEILILDEYKEDPTPETMARLKKSRDPKISFIFHKKTSAKDRVRIDDVDELFKVILTSRPDELVD